MFTTLPMAVGPVAIGSVDPAVLHAGMQVFNTASLQHNVRVGDLQSISGAQVATVLHMNTEQTSPA